MATNDTGANKPTDRGTADPQTPTERPWETDWSNLKRRREKAVDALPESIIIARKSRHLARKRDITTNRAARILSNNEIDIPDEVVL